MNKQSEAAKKRSEAAKKAAATRARRKLYRSDPSGIAKLAARSRKMGEYADEHPEATHEELAEMFGFDAYTVRLKLEQRAARQRRKNLRAKE